MTYLIIIICVGQDIVALFLTVD